MSNLSGAGSDSNKATAFIVIQAPKIIN